METEMATETATTRRTIDVTDQPIVGSFND